MRACSRPGMLILCAPWWMSMMASSVRPMELHFPISKTHAPKALLGCVINVVEHGAIPDDPRANISNALVINDALQSAKANSTILVPTGHFYVIGGIEALSPADGITFMLEGTLEFVFDLDHWPMKNDVAAAWSLPEHEFVESSASEYKDCITVDDSRGFTFTSSSRGTLIGNGKQWWNMVEAGQLQANARPRLFQAEHSRDLQLSHFEAINCPSWCLRIVSIRAEIFDIHVTIDRQFQSEVKQRMAIRAKRAIQDLEPRLSENDLEGIMILQPEDLNTDGIDVSGTDIHIHDCKIVNDDDSIAVKPASMNTTIIDGQVINCTERVLVENVELTGFGASVGSVGPSEDRPCVNNVTFRNITMPNSGKGIYVKSDKSDCDDANNVSSQISNVLYQDILIIRPRWYAVWIGPQQQHEPFTELAGDCALAYPVRKSCPTQGCTDFRNISLRNVHIQDPYLSPGVLKGNSSNPMVIEFENVTVTSSSGEISSWPFDGYDIENVVGTCKHICDPMPDSFVKI